jgi:protein phosphatase
MTDMRTKIQSFSDTDTGRIREHNEDAIGADEELGLYILADGMGGYNAGEVASGIAVRTILSMMREAYASYPLEGQDAATGLMRPSIMLRDAVQRANKIIHQTSKSQAQCEGMGTTVVAALFYDDRIVTAHVGDSRLYRVRNGALEQLTSDHSLLQELVDRGIYTRAEAERATSKNYVTRALGVEPTVEVDVREHRALPSDRYLMCSDGLTDMVEDRDIQHYVARYAADLKGLGQNLVMRANDNGGRDNISVVLTQVVEPFPARHGILNRISGWFR